MPDISFPSFPANWRLPLFWAELDPSQAGTGQPNQPSLLVGQAFLGAVSSAAKSGGNTGTGTLTLDSTTPILAGATIGTYKATFTSATAFTVTDGANVTVASGTVGTPFANQIKFNIVAGGTPFISGDRFDIPLTQLVVGNGVKDVPVAVGSLATVKRLAGEGSMLERMAARFFAINPVGVLYVAPLADPPASTAATGSVAVTVAPTDYGVFSLYIAGQRVQVAVSGTDTTTTVAAALAAAINAKTTLPVTAAAASGTVTLTCRWKGSTGNDIVVVPNFGGTLAGEVMPLSMAVSVTAMASGAGAPDMTALISNLGEDEYDFCGMPYTDSTSIAAWDSEYGFTAVGRWGYVRELYGTVFSARRDTYSNLMTWGPTGNSGVISVETVEPTSPSPVWEWSAAYVAQASAALLEDPARPLQTLELTGILPAPRQDRFNKNEANAMAGVGLAVQQVGPNGYPLIMVEATRWQVNAYGQPDAAYSLVPTLHTLAYLLRRFKAAITSKYPRHKLANDGTKFAAGQAIVTPKVLKAEIISEYRDAEYLGLVENTDAFIAHLIVERDSVNPSRVNVLWPPDVVNGLRIFAVLAQFRLQYANQPGTVAA